MGGELLNWTDLLEHIDRRFQELKEDSDRAEEQFHLENKAVTEKLHDLTCQISKIKQNQEYFDKLYQRQVKTEKDISEINEKLNTRLGKEQVFLAIVATVSSLIFASIFASIVANTIKFYNPMPAEKDQSILPEGQKSSD